MFLPALVCTEPWRDSHRELIGTHLYKNCFFVCYCPVGLVNASPQLYITARVPRAVPQAAATKADAPEKCTSFIQRDAGDLVLSLEQAGGKRQGECPPAASGSREDCI